MNATEIDHLISQIEQLQLTVNQTRTQLTDIRNRLGRNNEPREAQAEEQQEENEDPNRDLRIGDQVEVLNSVRLRGSIRSSRNVRGTVVRFTNLPTSLYE